ncbi:MAG TPA: hypothetical protein PLA68_12515, partial [Panacibacter sp.]|nr:hypothetical protein [Panacibacter sp.]
MKKISCFFFGLLSLNTILKSQPGSLDESFGAGGKVINEAFTGYCNAIAEQADGKIITGGILDAFKEDSTGIIIVRFNADGSLDENFGETGRVIAYKAEGGRAANVYAIAVQANCKIIICATFIKRPDDIDDVDVGLIRLNTDGTFDNSFGGNGVAIISIGKNDRVGDMALQPDGKIIVTGTKGADENEAQPIYIIRFLTNGELDESFGENGIALAPEIIDLRYVNPIVLQTDGKILVGGESFDSSYILVRFLPDGHIDSTFDEDRDGVASIKFEEIDLRYADLYDITVQPDGKILAAGTGGYDLSRIAIARFNSDGSVDSAFGDKPGYSILAMDSGFARASDVYTTDNNSILLTGSYITGVNSNMAVVKYKDDGTLDSSFGENGLALGNLISEG